MYTIGNNINTSKIAEKLYHIYSRYDRKIFFWDICVSQNWRTMYEIFILDWDLLTADDIHQTRNQLRTSTRNTRRIFFPQTDWFSDIITSWFPGFRRYRTGIIMVLDSDWFLEGITRESSGFLESGFLNIIRGVMNLTSGNDWELQNFRKNYNSLP